MNTPTSPVPDSNGTDHPVVEQLSLLPRVLADPQVPVQFRLDRRTRERGLAHIAALRQQLLERRERHDSGHRAA